MICPFCQKLISNVQLVSETCIDHSCDGKNREVKFSINDKTFVYLTYRNGQVMISGNWYPEEVYYQVNGNERKHKQQLWKILGTSGLKVETNEL